ncbi:hypothetical protein ABIB14_001961 [Arthrobacter sp. UYEF3]
MVRVGMGVDTCDDFGCFVCQDGKVPLSRVFNADGMGCGPGGQTER